MREFSKAVSLAHVSEPERLELEATPAEAEAVARRFGIPAVKRLAARVLVTPMSDGQYRVAGSLTAEVTQECVVTFEPVSTDVETEFTRVFGPVGTSSLEIELDPLADEVEPIEGESLDLGEIVVEELSLALDPYPRAADADAVLAEVQDPDDEDGTVDERHNPFASLKDKLVSKVAGAGERG